MATNPGLTCGFHGFDGRPGLYGAAYFEALAHARMGLNLNSDRAETATERAPAAELHLYNSDRLSQAVGCGLLTLSFRVNDLMQLFEDGREMVFADTPEAMVDAALKIQTRRLRSAPDRGSRLAQGARRL